jgi:hypothetical protein
MFDIRGDMGRYERLGELSRIIKGKLLKGRAQTSMVLIPKEAG